MHKQFNLMKYQRPQSGVLDVEAMVREYLTAPHPQPLLKDPPPKYEELGQQESPPPQYQETRPPEEQGQECPPPEYQECLQDQQQEKWAKEADSF